MNHVVIVFREEAVVKVFGPYFEPQANYIARLTRDADRSLTVEVHPMEKV